MGDNETLFSLELAVNSLRIDPRTVICRMPAVAFRLLDFPSILVEQLDHVEAKQLKVAIQNTWEYEENIPPQLGELKDRHGNHEFQKGKSSLYRYKLESLVSHLDNTPLYIMIVDVWTAVPKLVAHCNVSLKEAIHRIRQDVSEFGVSVPSVHGIQGKFPIFNLMGTEIGWISLGVRLLSLGGNLLPHIADASLTKKESTVAKDYNRDGNIPEQNLKVPHSVSVPHTSVRSDHQRSEDDPKNIREDFSCQTSDGTKNEAKVGATKKSKQVPSKSTRMSADHLEIDDKWKYLDTVAVHEENDVFITNTHIPPPLIYNSANDVKVKSSRQYRVPEKVKYEPQSSSPLRSVIKNNSGTVSPDLDSRKDLEVQYVIHPPKFNSSPNVRKILRSKKKAQSTVPINMMHSDAQNKEVKRNHIAEREIEAPLTDNIEHLHKLPILQALLRELSILNRRDADAVAPGSHGQDDFVSNKSSGKHPTKDRLSGQHLSTPQVHEELKVPQSKPTVQRVYRHKHKDCAKPPSGVPASKGWLRQQPRYGKKKKETKLKFKMTNSQKLRIQRHNPEAFRQLEEEERIAEIEFQMRAAAEMQIEEAKMSKVGRKSEQRPPGPYPSENTLPSPEAYLSTEIARHPDQEQIDVEDLEADVFKRGMETFKIPTKEPIDENEVEEVSDEEPSLYHRVDEKDASESDKSVRSISVHLPTATVQEYEDDEEESSSDESQQEGPKPVSVPGFPEDLQEDKRPQEPVTPAPGYSDDFDESYRYVSTGEQELANIQSSIASGASSSAPQDHSVEHSDSDHSNGSSYKTAESLQSAKIYKAVEDQPSRIVDPSYVVNPPSKSSSSSASSRHPPSILSIPQPQMSANSPIPIVRRSSAKSAIFGQPPQPKPRISLDQTSSISNVSALAPGLTLSNTLESSEVNTFDLKPDLSEEYEQNEAYSDDFESDN